MAPMVQVPTRTQGSGTSSSTSMSVANGSSNSSASSSSSKLGSSSTRPLAKVPSNSSVQMSSHQSIILQHQPQTRRVGSPPCSPRTANRIAPSGSSNSNRGPAATSGASLAHRGALEAPWALQKAAQATKNNNSGSYVPPPLGTY
eukprot:TRINITY_DN29707_c0_g1_i1.p1 TRINITY_DN29707_c0_g1~~TRINITY_DN29707_c0_g1_i1.p1  ORF type:complete len:145 (-),score=20.03 TRINITY_DN29707_c0_g1_i1:109-543(-)